MNKKNNKIFNGVRDYFKLKSWLILIIMLFLGIGLAVLIVNFEFKEDIALVRAGSNDNLTGFAWSENIGWISFNCTNDNSCGTVDYGVNIDQATGNISGYAWSSNIGWISFNRKTCNGGVDIGQSCMTDSDCSGGNQCRSDAPGTTGDPPAEPFLSSGTVIANYNSDTGQVTGWAKILILGDDGWLKLRKFGSDGGSDYGLTIDPASGNFSGWAWNGNDIDGVGIGWVSFNCLDSDICDTSDYKVTTIANTLPEAIDLSAPNWDYTSACLYAKQAFLRWEFSDSDEESSQSAYQIILNDNNNINSPVIDTGKITGIQGEASQHSFGPDDLIYEEEYWWWVKVWDNHDVSSELTAGPSFTTYKHEFPDVDFSWSPAEPSRDEEVRFVDNSDYYTIANPDSNPVDCDEELCGYSWGFPEGTTIIEGSITASSTVVVKFSSSGNQPVNLDVTDGDGYNCNKQINVNLKVSLPDWKEVKPR